MSVVRSIYRQIIRQGTLLAKKYPDPNDLCSAIFGIALTRAEFAAAGYGDNFTRIARSCFDRPLISGDARDTTAARISLGFSILKDLHELHLRKNDEALQKRRKEIRCMDRVVEVKPQEDPAESLEKIDIDAEHTAPPPSVEQSGSDANAQTGEGNYVEGGDRVVSPNEDGVVSGIATILIERSNNRKLQKLSRHIVVCEDHTLFPAYPYLLPPEPMYPINIRIDRAFPMMNDAIVCLAAASRQRKVEQEKEEEQQRALTTASASEAFAHSPPEAVSSSTPTAAAAAVPPMAMTMEEWQAALKSIPTRSIAHTDCIEVEVYTQYVCANPHQVSSDATRLEPARDSASSSSASVATSSSSSSSRADSSSSEELAHLFVYYVFVRNKGPAQNPKKWHVQVLSHHMVVFDPVRCGMLEMVRPGLMGNAPLLGPGESHVLDSGTSLLSTEGVLRGTIQVNAFCETGEMRILDVAIAPTRLSTSMKQPLTSDTFSARTSSSRRADLNERSSDTAASSTCVSSSGDSSS